MPERGKNKKALILMASALGLFAALIGYAAAYNNSKNSSARMFLGILGGFVFGLAAVSLVIWTCRIVRWIKDGFIIDEYGYQVEPDEPKNIKTGCRRIAIILAGLAAIVCGSVFLELPISQNNQSKLEFRKYQEQEKTGRSPGEFDPKLPLRLKDDYWLNLRKGQFVGICVSVFLLGAALGSCAVWFGYRYLEELVLNCMGKQSD